MRTAASRRAAQRFAVMRAEGQTKGKGPKVFARRNLEGQRFGNLLVLFYAGNPRFQSGLAHTAWWCQCSCGTEVIVPTGRLTNGDAKSCGCNKNQYKPTHGMARHGGRAPEHLAWSHMKDRCTNPNSQAWKDYGGRGIRVCEKWINSFEEFFACVGPRPSPKHSIDRWPNNDGHYEPGNVRWATKKEQLANRRTYRKRAA